MESNSNGDFGFERSTGLSAPASNFPICSGFLVSNCASSSQIAADSIASCLKASSVSPLEMVEPFSACWESLVSMDGNGSLREDFSSSGRQEPLYEINQKRGIDLDGYHSNGSLVGSAPSFSCLMSARYPDNKNNYSLLESTTISTVSPGAHQLSDSNQGIRIDDSTTNAKVKILGSGKEFEGADWGIADEDEEQNKEGRILSPLIDSRKRKRMPDGISSDLNPSIDRAQKEENVGGSPNKLNARETKDQNQNSEAQKEYIHVRARRGQATNSHSLAERVRREKISERMRFLQDLVPGCSKVTGKAVMLDEIINYVQSLQRQVEFLSMKLATVIPEFDMTDIVLKNNFPSGGGRGSALLGFTPNVSRSCHTINVYPLESIERGTEEMDIIKNFDNILSSMNPQFVQMEQVRQVPNTWDNELQNVVQMGFVSPPNVGIPPKDGNLKVDN